MKAGYKKISCCNGDLYVNVMMGILAVLMVMSILISFLPPYIKYQQLNSLCNDYTNFIESIGVIDETAEQELRRLKDNYNIEVENVRYETAYIPGTSKIQLEDEFIIKMQLKTAVGIPIYGEVEIMLEAQGAGRSEIYWK